MSKDLGDLGASVEPTEPSKTGPDYFAFYTSEIQKLISPDEDFLPFLSQPSASLERARGLVGEKDVISHNYNGQESSLLASFDEAIGARLSDFKRERLKSLLQQTVVSLSQEVDEILDPVFSIRHIQSQLRSRKRVTNRSAAACEGDEAQPPTKKITLSSLSSSASPSSSGSDNKNEDADLPENGKLKPQRGPKMCALCHAPKTTTWRTLSTGCESCNACGIRFEKEKVTLSGKEQNTASCCVSNIEANNEVKEVNKDLQFLLENNTVNVESSMKKYSDELITTLGHMEQQLEGLLDLMLSSCRLMNLTDKQQLQKQIQKLPPRNLDRVVEILQRNNPLRNYSSDEIHVDLEKEDNVTLWRLCCCVKAIANARKLVG